MRKQHILYIVIITILFGFMAINNGYINDNNVSALNYQTSANIGFTFLPTLNVSLSNDNLIINNLVPGGGAVDSNIITINVSTNIEEGYNLIATVGSSNDGSNNNSNTNTNANIATNTTAVNNGYNTANLVNVVDNSYTFAPLSSNVSELSSFTNNTWGYSYCVSNCISASDTPNPNWISGDYNNASTGYNGLPLYTDTGIKLVEKADSTNSTVNFKIAAKTSNTQPSGEYTNTINFAAISNIVPTTMLDAFIASGAKMHNGYFKMQDMTPTICKSIDTNGEKGMQLIDVRDDKVYWVAKLKDGNCWMTQNLDLDLSSTVALTSETSDIDPESYGKTIYATETGYSKDKDTGVVSWLPSTIDEDGIQRADTIDMVWSSNTAATAPGWTNDNYKPYSADAGDRYLYTNPTTFTETVYASLKDCTDNNNEDIAGCQHAHFGNYYNWSAAVASNNTAGASKNQPNSICPKNWSLPINGAYSTLMREQGVYSGSIHYAENGFNKLRTSPLYYMRFKSISNGSLSIYSYADYWSSTSNNETYSYGLYFVGDNIWPSYASIGKAAGVSMRCMANAN